MTGFLAEFGWLLGGLDKFLLGVFLGRIAYPMATYSTSKPANSILGRGGQCEAFAKTGIPVKAANMVHLTFHGCQVSDSTA